VQGWLVQRELVRDMTTSFAHIGRGSMDVVAHHGDLFFWKNNYTHMSTLHEYRLRDIMECGNESPCRNTMFSLCWPLTLQCHVSNE
jgi:hypothetical protein